MHRFGPAKTVGQQAQGRTKPLAFRVGVTGSSLAAVTPTSNTPRLIACFARGRLGASTCKLRVSIWTR